MTVFTDRFSTLAPDYDVVLSDVWGVTHNGLAAFPEACEALSRFRAGGGIVILITNAPRPAHVIARQLERFRVPAAAYDGIVSSGDVTRRVLAERLDQRVFHLGPERDMPIFEGLDVRFAPVEEADYVICTGLADDESESPDDYRPLLDKMHARRLFMVCGNPDVVVERGNRLHYCAGAIADLYAALGGEVLYAGKPYPPIYDQALALAESVSRRKHRRHRVLAIGDSVRTDVKGAANLEIDCLFVTGGIHAEELGARDNPDPAALEKIFAAAGVRPRAVTRRLAW